MRRRWQRCRGWPPRWTTRSRRSFPSGRRRSAKPPDQRTRDRGDPTPKTRDLLAVDIPALAARLPPAPLTRFAPAPTGWLHLGHVLNARYVWEAARALGGRVLLRIEDHDRIRSRPAFEAGILDDLDWLGFHPDIFPTSTFRGQPCQGRQSDRDRVYREA